ncbi:glycosyl hydrolase [Synechococcus bigranulatus str. 'Rupite']|uniref:beta-N-acetylhexosaminidase n=2 Tax=Thermostichus vulcanus TaxID=32053 RepID=A0ABT0CDC6_THEVL|nr:glycosyl hydrolase [Thermostichus vulcanus str. 'Rupite']
MSGAPPLEFGQPLSLARQVAQLLVVPVSAQLGSLHAPVEGSPYPSRELLRKLVQEVGIGGVWLRDGHVAEAILLIEQLQDWASLPLLVAVDAGRGLALPGATSFPHPLGLSRLGAEAESWAEQWGRITSREAAAIGINWLLSPVVVPQAELAGLALAEDPATVLSLARAFVGGCEQTALDMGSGILTTARSFPGLASADPLQEGSRFGPTTPDTPWRPQLTTPVAQLQDTLWLPVRHLVHQVGAILVSHVVLPEWDERWPITLLPGRLTQLLRQEWGFTGLIVVDALDQGFLAELADPVTLAVRALQAGADLILAPPNPIQVMQGILDALQPGSQAQGYSGQGSLNPAQVAQSVTRILRAKQRTMGGVSALLKEVWPALAETDFSTVPGWMGATERTDPGLNRGSPAEQLKPVLLGDPITKDSALGKLFSVRPGLPSRLQGAERLGLLLAEADIAPCQAAMARGGVEGGQPLTLPAEPGWLNWIWQDLPLSSGELNLESPALRIPSALRIPPFCSNALTPLPLLEAALAKATGLMVQCFVQDPLPNYVLDMLQQQRERIAAVVFYGSLPLYRRLQEQFHWVNTVHSLNRDPFAQAEVMRRLFPHLSIAEGVHEAGATIKKK